MMRAPREASRDVGCAMVSEGDGDPGGRNYYKYLASSLHVEGLMFFTGMKRTM